MFKNILDIFLAKNVKIGLYYTVQILLKALIDFPTQTSLRCSTSLNHRLTVSSYISVIVLTNLLFSMQSLIEITSVWYSTVHVLA